MNEMWLQKRWELGWVEPKDEHPGQEGDGETRHSKCQRPQGLLQAWECGQARWPSGEIESWGWQRMNNNNFNNNDHDNTLVWHFVVYAGPSYLLAHELGEH